MSLALAVKENIPSSIQRALEEVDSAFVLGGFILSCMHGYPISDVDVFCRYSDIKRFVSYLELDDSNIQVVCTDYPSEGFSKTTHVLKTKVQGMNLDLVAYSGKYDLTRQTDFFCRMLTYNGHTVNAPHEICFHDAANKILRFNSYYKMHIFEYYDVFMIAAGRNCGCERCQDFMTKVQRTMLRNIQKYIAKGYQII